MAARRGSRLRAVALALALAVGPGAAACTLLQGGNPIRRLTNVGVEAERETGYRVDLELREQLRLIDDPTVLRLVHELGQSMVDTLGDQPFVYHFRVIDDPSLNAFALPGGYVYFHSGTILEAATLDELAGVMAHEIAHVKARHWARRSERTAIPNLLSTIAGILATAATGEPGALIVSQGVNVAMQLQFTREFEVEADRLASTFMVRSGYDPEGMARFLERLVVMQEAAEAAGPRLEIPPYLYTHPDPALRVDAARARAEKLTLTGSHDPQLAPLLLAAQHRLAHLVASGRSELRMRGVPSDRRAGDEALAEMGRLAEAGRLADAGRLEGALEILEKAARAEPGDPRIPFRRGELLEEAGRPREAIEAYQRAITLDSGVGLTWYRVGLLYREQGEPADAAFYLEQAERRFEKGGERRQHTRRILERLTFPILEEAGLGDGAEDPGAPTPGGHPRERFGPGDARVVWWGRVADRWGGVDDRLRVRFVDPAGRVVQEEAPESLGSGAVGSSLALDGPATDRTGTWQVHVLLGKDVVDRQSFRLEAAGASEPPVAGAQSL